MTYSLPYPPHTHRAVGLRDLATYVHHLDYADLSAHFRALRFCQPRHDYLERLVE